MAAGFTYEPLYTNTLISNTATVSFSSFSGYTDLVLVINGIMSTSGASVYMDFNGVITGGLYSYTLIRGNGSTATSGGGSASIGEPLGGTNGYTASRYTIVCNIQDYANTTTYKSSLVRWSQADGLTEVLVNLWASTAAITSLTVKNNDTHTFLTGSTFTLYGIKAA